VFGVTQRLEENLLASNKVYSRPASSSHLYGAGAFTQDGQRQRSQVCSATGTASLLTFQQQNVCAVDQKQSSDCVPVLCHKLMGLQCKAEQQWPMIYPGCDRN